MDTREDTITGGRMVTRELAAWVAELRYEDFPAPVVEEAGRAFADFLGECLFVGATKPWGQTIADFCAREGGGQPEATIIASGKKTLSSRAALANGTMALGFEYADFGGGGRPYPFAVTAPLALAESRHRSGQDFILGIVIGYEVMARVMNATIQPAAEVRAGALRHVRFGGGLRAGARPVAATHHVCTRARSRVHGRHVPGTRRGCMATLAQRRHGQ